LTRLKKQVELAQLTTGNLLLPNFSFLMLVVVLIGILMYIYAGSTKRWDGEHQVKVENK
jgi:uncharacterized membrane protein